MSIDIEVSVICDVCDSTLSGVYERGVLRITPCESCITYANEAGYEEGKADIDSEIENLKAEYEDLLENKSDRIVELEEEIFRLQGDNLREALKDNDQIILELKEAIATLEEELGWSLNKATVPLD